MVESVDEGSMGRWAAMLWQRVKMALFFITMAKFTAKIPKHRMDNTVYDFALAMVKRDRSRY